jgi:hypothetical protein
MAYLTFAEALALAAEKATATLAPELHQRLAEAVDLVREGHTFQTDAGLWQVNSLKHPGLTYTVNGSCECADAHYNKPAYCKHRLAMFLAQRVHTLMAQPAPPIVPDVVEPYPDNDHEGAPASPAVPLPEAPASVNCHIMLEGRQVQVTLRGTDETQLLQRLAAVLKAYPAPARAEAAPRASQGQGQDKAWCTLHNTAMRWNDGKDGRKGWYSHRTEQGWCKGR